MPELAAFVPRWTQTRLVWLLHPNLVCSQSPLPAMASVFLEISKQVTCSSGE